MLRQGVFLDVHTLMQTRTPWPAGRPECFISSPSLVFAFGHYLDNRQRVVASWKSVCLLMYPLLCLTITLPSYPAPFKHPNYVWEICSLMDLALSGQHPENLRLRLLCNRIQAIGLDLPVSQVLLNLWFVNKQSEETSLGEAMLVALVAAEASNNQGQPAREVPRCSRATATVSISLSGPFRFTIWDGSYYV